MNVITKCSYRLEQKTSPKTKARYKLVLESENLESITKEYVWQKKYNPSHKLRVIQKTAIYKLEYQTSIEAIICQG